MAISRSDSTSLGLISGLSLAAHAIKSNALDGAGSQWRALKQDKLFCIFLAGSTASFAGLAAREYLQLRAQRAEERRLALLRQGTAAAHDSKTAGKKKKRVDTGKDFWKQLVFLLRIAVPSASGRGAQLLAAQFFLLVMRTLISVKTAKLSVYYLTTAMSKGSWTHWTRWLSNFAAWTVMGTTVNTGLKYFESLIALEVRDKVTKHAHAKYLGNSNKFYRAALMQRGALDNVDQRIVADIEAWSANVAQLYGHSFKPILEFSMSLYEASKELGYARPVALFATQTLFTIFMRTAVPSLGAMVVKEQALEGSFRHAHSRLVGHAEEVAFLQGAPTERKILDENLKTLTGAKGWHNLMRARNSIAEQFAKFQGIFIGGVFVHIPFLVRNNLGEAERIASFRSTEELMLKCGSNFVELILLGKSLNELSGYTQRIHELLTALEDCSGERERAGAGAQEGGSRAQQIVFTGLCVDTPEPDGTSRTLLKDLDLQMVAGKNVLVTGPNGCGKTSLFRVLAGLWPPAAGTVLCPQSELMWLPQRPYLVMGTLRDQVAYPMLLGYSKLHDRAILECLEMVGLTKLVEADVGLDLTQMEWNDVLSGGERQRIGFARLYFHKPLFAVLDEATSAINPDEEHRLYEKVQSLGTTVFSIAHRLELRKFHQWELRIEGDGSGKWELEPL
ncbi:hypothetical protein CYMTET_7938 [Cymbomonas tetramitiformis]|uniref:ABC transporter domain-containing protein n=1 Tax=Cymbomonas tetramitiformis TaxID=36881 RepID=A0AAE0GU64_9CHLO|nr:hypothetical protein CYMTET_7938 [Cymbomonas tetramitiformis]